MSVKHRDGHRIRVIVESGACTPVSICPFVGIEESDSPICTKDMCGIQEDIHEVGWELFYKTDVFEITSAPFEIEWSSEGAGEEWELYIYPVPND